MAIRVKQAAEILGVSPSTVRNWCRNGELECQFNAAGQRVFDKHQLELFKNKKLGIHKEEPTHTTVFYIRSSNGSDVLLDTQVELLTKKFGEPYKTYSDKASGLSENRRGLKSLIRAAKNKEFTRVCITNKDRLTRFGYSYLEELFNGYDIEIITLDKNDSPKEPHEVLMQDFMSLIASFSGKFYRLRGYENQKKLLADAGEYIEQKTQ